MVHVLMQLKKKKRDVGSQKLPIKIVMDAFYQSRHGDFKAYFKFYIWVKDVVFWKNLDQ